jgi:hypothetical protein
MDSLTRGRSLALLALVAATVVTAEVLFTRVLSVVTWYGLAFVVLSLAMLGLTRGSLLASEARERGEPLGPWIAARLSDMSLRLLVATTVLVSMPLTFARNLSSFASLVLVAAATAAPLVSGGAVVARLMSEAPVALPTLYAIDLVAAAVGALAPLVLLGPMTGPGALVLLAALMAVASLMASGREGKARAATLMAVCMAVVAVSEQTSWGFVLRYPKGFPRNDQEVPTFEAWNPLSHVRVGPFGPSPIGFMWSPSPLTPAATVIAANAQIDGEAATPIYEFRHIAELNFLRFDATTSAHQLRPTGTACVIGVGGGRDLASALVYGHDRVFGVEINPAMVTMLRSVARRSPIITDPRVFVRVGDGRAEYARARTLHCEVLQASLVDTWAATSAGAFAHTESTLYTREAWNVFLNRTAPNGIVTFSRWYDPRKVSETSRLVSLAVASLRDRGVTNPRANIALVASMNVATILVSASPFSPTDVANLHSLVNQRQFRLLIAPDTRPESSLLDQLLNARTDEQLAAAGVVHGLDTSPPNDDRPFFFQLMHPSLWLHPKRTLAMVMGGPGVLEGNVMAMFELVVAFFIVFVLGVSMLGPTLWRAARESTPALPGWRSTVYFGALGAGFMAAEIALVQRMHVVLGHPTYALVVVLAGLLVATGAGSALSPRVMRTRKHVSMGALVAAAVLIALPFVVIRPLAHATIDSSYAVRAAWSGACAAVVGVILGMMFPSGVRFVDRSRGASVALAVNGATSVLGSVAAITISVGVGIPATFVLAGLVYVLAAWVGPHSWRSVDGSDGEQSP